MAIAKIGGKSFGGLNREVHTNMDTELEGFLNSLGEAERAGGRVLAAFPSALRSRTLDLDQSMGWPGSSASDSAVVKNNRGTT